MSLNRQDPFVREVEATLTQFAMLGKQEAVLAGVSGGPDSVALVRVLLCLKEKYDLTLGIAHLNHGLRGEESHDDEGFVKKLAQGFGLAFFREKKDVRSLAKEQGLSVEEAGRNARYEFFRKIALAQGFSRIATGHTLDDNAELVLMNLLRGSGPRGLRGIPPVRENLFIRPLIQMAKSRILAFLAAQDQAFVLDASNEDPAYLRNRIRHQLIPHLEQTFNPEIKSCLDRLSRIIWQEEDFLEDQARLVFQTCALDLENKGLEPSQITLSMKKLSLNHPAIVNRVLRQAIARVKKDLRRITHTHILDILSLMARSEPGKSLDLPGQIRVYKDRDFLYIQKEVLPLRELGRKQKKFRQNVKEKSQGKT